jgi:hypothetical protein
MAKKEVAQQLHDAALPLVEKEINRLAAEGANPLDYAFAVLHSSSGRVLESLTVEFPEAKTVLLAGDEALPITGPRSVICDHFERARAGGAAPPLLADKFLLFIQVEDDAFMWPLDFVADGGGSAASN